MKKKERVKGGGGRKGGESTKTEGLQQNTLQWQLWADTSDGSTADAFCVGRGDEWLPTHWPEGREDAGRCRNLQRTRPLAKYLVEDLDQSGSGEGTAKPAGPICLAKSL